MSRILVIEDDFQLLRLCTRILQNAGHEVYPAAAYHAALDMFRLYRSFSLCISDITVGVYQPMILIRELYQLRAQFDTPMLVMSAHMEKYRVICDELSLPTLDKPFFSQSLLDQVNTLIKPTRPEQAVL